MNRGIKVKIVETGEIFDSVKSCADYISASPSSVSKVVLGNNRYHTCHGYHIVPADRLISDVDIHRKEYRGRPGIKVRVVETGKEYNSIADCAKAINGSPGTIHDILHNNRNRSTHKGLHFECINWAKHEKKWNAKKTSPFMREEEIKRHFFFDIL